MFEHSLSIDCENLVWRAYFSGNVLPLLHRDVMTEVYEEASRLALKYCEDVLDEFVFGRRLDEIDWDPSMSSSEIHERLLDCLYQYVL